MGTNAMAFCKLIAQYIHNEPTFYDRVFNKQYYEDWLVEDWGKKKSAKAQAQVR